MKAAAAAESSKLYKILQWYQLSLAGYVLGDIETLHINTKDTIKFDNVNVILCWSVIFQIKNSPAVEFHYLPSFQTYYHDLCEG